MRVAAKNLSHVIKTSKMHTFLADVCGVEVGLHGQHNKFVIGTNLDYFK